MIKKSVTKAYLFGSSLYGANIRFHLVKGSLYWFETLLLFGVSAGCFKDFLYVCLDVFRQNLKLSILLSMNSSQLIQAARSRLGDN